jgi:YbbR domain-containing protein
VDLADARPGTADYPVNYTLPNGLTIAYIRPDFVEITVDVFETIELPVLMYESNSVKQGYKSTEPVISPSTVEVSGPKRALDDIAEAAVRLDLSGRTSDFNEVLPVLLFERGGQEFQDRRVRLSQEEVSVYVGISENLSSKSVPVRAPLPGSVNNRYIVTGVEVQPSTVKITGPYATISTIDYLNTEAVNLSSITDTFHGSIKLITPPGVEVLEGDEVEITIMIEKNLIIRTYEGVPVEIRNAGDGAEYTTLPATVDVTLATFLDILEKADASGETRPAIVAYVDIADLEALPEADENLPVMLEIPDDYTVVSISSGMVRLSEGSTPEDIG